MLTVKIHNKRLAKFDFKAVNARSFIVLLLASFTKKKNQGKNCSMEQLSNKSSIGDQYVD